MIKNVLVYPCGSEIGLEIYRSLSNSTHFALYGGSAIDDHGKFVYENYISDLPFVGDPDFLDRMNQVIEELSIDFIYPAHDSVVLKLAEAKHAGALKCEVVTSPYETCVVARSKLTTYDVLQNVVATPALFGSNSLEEVAYPIFLKPDVGQGSKGTYVARTAEDVGFYTKKDPTLLIMEYLPGPEYTIDCFTTSDGLLQFAEGRLRRRIAGGISVNSVQVIDDRFTEIATKINRALDFRGAWFFQLKERAGGELVLMEIAPRIAGTMGLVRCKGVNLPLLSLFNLLGYNVEISENKYSIEIDRALENRYALDLLYKHVYLDFDDMVIYKDKVNPRVMAFVFQCHNNGVIVHLITRHSKDLTKTLQKYRLEAVFNEIIWITDSTDEKSSYITEKDAIFIDDSYAERAKVHKCLGIPVFDFHMLESLLEI